MNRIKALRHNRCSHHFNILLLNLHLSLIDTVYSVNVDDNGNVIHIIIDDHRPLELTNVPETIAEIKKEKTSCLVGIYARTALR